MADALSTATSFSGSAASSESSTEAPAAQTQGSRGLHRTRAGRFTPSRLSHHFLLFDASVSRQQRVALYTAACAVLPDTPYVGDVAEPRLIVDPLHPAFGQYGLFSKVRIPSQTVIMSYGGFVQMHASFPCSQAYTMGYGGLNERLEIDSEFIGNLARFANDPRGCAGSANIIAQTKLSRLGESYTALITRRAILPDEELLLSYGAHHRLAGQPWVTRSGTCLTRRRYAPAPDVELLRRFEVLWQCADCGSWTPRSPSTNRVAVCGRCGAPRTAHAQLCAVPKEESTDAPSTKSHRTESPDKAPADAAGSDAQAADDVRSPGSDDALAVESNLVASHFVTHRCLVTQQASPMYTQPAAVPAPWPLDFPFVPWQLWDPEVPLLTIRAYAAPFTPQPELSVCEIVHAKGVSVGVFSNDAHTAGAEIGAAGGLVVHAADVRAESAAAVPLGACAEELLAIADVAPPLTLLVTNEAACIRRVDAGAANVRFTLKRDPLGFLYVAVVALRPIDRHEELVASRSR